MNFRIVSFFLSILLLLILFTNQKISCSPATVTRHFFLLQGVNGVFVNLTTQNLPLNALDDFVFSGSLGPRSSLTIQNSHMRTVLIDLIFHPGSKLIVNNNTISASLEFYPAQNFNPLNASQCQGANMNFNYQQFEQDRSAFTDPVSISITNNKIGGPSAAWVAPIDYPFAYSMFAGIHFTFLNFCQGFNIDPILTTADYYYDAVFSPSSATAEMLALQILLHRMGSAKIEVLDNEIIFDFSSSADLEKTSHVTGISIFNPTQNTLKSMSESGRLSVFSSSDTTNTLLRASEIVVRGNSVRVIRNKLYTASAISKLINSNSRNKVQNGITIGNSYCFPEREIFPSDRANQDDSSSMFFPIVRDTNANFTQLVIQNNIIDLSPFQYGRGITIAQLKVFTSSDSSPNFYLGERIMKQTPHLSSLGDYNNISTTDMETFPRLNITISNNRITFNMDQVVACCGIGSDAFGIFLMTPLLNADSPLRLYSAQMNTSNFFVLNGPIQNLGVAENEIILKYDDEAAIDAQERDGRGSFNRRLFGRVRGVSIFHQFFYGNFFVDTNSLVTDSSVFRITSRYYNAATSGTNYTILLNTSDPRYHDQQGVPLDWWLVEDQMNFYFPRSPLTPSTSSDFFSSIIARNFMNIQLPFSPSSTFMYCVRTLNNKDFPLSVAVNENKMIILASLEVRMLDIVVFSDLYSSQKGKKSLPKFNYSNPLNPGGKRIIAELQPFVFIRCFIANDNFVNSSGDFVLQGKWQPYVKDSNFRQFRVTVFNFFGVNFNTSYSLRTFNNNNNNNNNNILAVAVQNTFVTASFKNRNQQLHEFQQGAYCFVAKFTGMQEIIGGVLYKNVTMRLDKANKASMFYHEYEDHSEASRGVNAQCNESFFVNMTGPVIADQIFFYFFNDWFDLGYPDDNYDRNYFDVLDLREVAKIDNVVQLSNFVVNGTVGAGGQEVLNLRNINNFHGGVLVENGTHIVAKAMAVKMIRIRFWTKCSFLRVNNITAEYVSLEVTFAREIQDETEIAQAMYRDPATYFINYYTITNVNLKSLVRGPSPEGVPDYKYAWRMDLFRTGGFFVREFRLENISVIDRSKPLNQPGGYGYFPRVYILSGQRAMRTIVRGCNVSVSATISLAVNLNDVWSNLSAYHYSQELLEISDSRFILEGRDSETGQISDVDGSSTYILLFTWIANPDGLTANPDLLSEKSVPYQLILRNCVLRAAGGAYSSIVSAASTAFTRPWIIDGGSFESSVLASLVSCKYPASIQVPQCVYFNDAKMDFRRLNKSICGTLPSEEALISVMSKPNAEVTPATIRMLYASGVLRFTVVNNLNVSCWYSLTDTKSSSIATNSLLPTSSKWRNSQSQSSTESEAPMPQPPSSDQIQFTSVSSSVSVAASVVSAAIASPTVALDAGRALAQLGILVRCQQYEEARSKLAKEDQAKRGNILVEAFARFYLNRKLSFPTSFLPDWCFGATKEGSCMRGAVVGGYFFLLIAVCCATLMGFGITFLGFRKLKSRYEENLKDYQMMMMMQSEDNNKNNSTNFKRGLWNNYNNNHHRYHHPSSSPPVFPFQDAIKRARYPFVIGTAISMQLPNWAANAITLLINPFYDSTKLSFFKEKIILGAIPLVLFWLLLWIAFSIYLWNRSLSRKFEQEQRMKKRGRGNLSRSEQFKYDTKRAESFQLEKVYFWHPQAVRAEYDEIEDNHNNTTSPSSSTPSWKYPLFKFIEQDLCDTKTSNGVLDLNFSVGDNNNHQQSSQTKKFEDLLLSHNQKLKMKNDEEDETNKKKKSLKAYRKFASRFIFGDYCWSIGPTRNSIMNGEATCFLRQCGGLINKFHGPLCQKALKDDFIFTRQNETNNNNNNKRKNNQPRLRNTIAPFTTFIQSIWLIISVATEVVAGIYPNKCNSVMTVLLVVNLLSFVFGVVVRPHLAPIQNFNAISSDAVNAIGSIFGLIAMNLLTSSSASSFVTYQEVHHARELSSSFITAAKVFTYFGIVISLVVMIVGMFVKLLTVTGYIRNCTESEYRSLVNQLKKKIARDEEKIAKRIRSMSPTSLSSASNLNLRKLYHQENNQRSGDDHQNKRRNSRNNINSDDESFNKRSKSAGRRSYDEEELLNLHNKGGRHSYRKYRHADDEKVNHNKSNKKQNDIYRKGGNSSGGGFGMDGDFF